MLVVLAVASLGLSGMTGPVALSLSLPELHGALRALVHGGADSMAATLLELRLSRAMVAFVTGAALSLASIMMQALLRNPLADPYVRGISAGASVGALLALLSMGALWMVDAAAFGGAVAVAMMLYVLARRDIAGAAAAAGGASVLLLTGVILSSACMALVTLMLSIAPESRLRGMVFWMIGDLAGAMVFALRSAKPCSSVPTC